MFENHKGTRIFGDFYNLEIENDNSHTLASLDDVMIYISFSRHYFYELLLQKLEFMTIFVIIWLRLCRHYYEYENIQ